MLLSVLAQNRQVNWFILKASCSPNMEGIGCNAIFCEFFLFLGIYNITKRYKRDRKELKIVNKFLKNRLKFGLYDLPFGNDSFC